MGREQIQRCFIWWSCINLFADQGKSLEVTRGQTPSVWGPDPKASSRREASGRHAGKVNL